MAAAGDTYNKITTPDKRGDLADYFPALRIKYSGYIQQEMFKRKLADALSAALEVSKKMEEWKKRWDSQQDLYKTIYPVRSNSFLFDSLYEDLKTAIDREVDSRVWLEWAKEEYYAKKMSRLGDNYFAAAGKNLTTDLATRMILEPVTGGLSTVAKNRFNAKVVRSVRKGKLDKKWGNRLSKLTDTYQYRPKETFKKKSKEWSHSLLEFNLFDYGVGKAADKSLEGWKMMGEAATGSKWEMEEIEIGFGNITSWLPDDMDSSWKNAIGHIANAFDFVSDFSWHAGVAKTGASFIANAATGVMYKLSAQRIEAMQDENAARWQEMSEDIKARVKADLHKLSNEDINNLCKMLNVK